MKKLYIIIGDAGDGSNFLRYTFSEEVVNALYDADQNGDLDESYMSGDGVQVHTLTVPEDNTYAGLGIPDWSVLDVSEIKEA